MTKLMELIDAFAGIPPHWVVQHGEARAAVVEAVEKLEAAQYRPAPCHKFCEATAFKIVIRNLESENARLRNLLSLTTAELRYGNPHDVETDTYRYDNDLLHAARAALGEK